MEDMQKKEEEAGEEPEKDEKKELDLGQRDMDEQNLLND
jgi:hypothetical protein